MAWCAFSGVCRFVRGARVRCAFGDAGTARRAPVPGRGLRAAGLRALQGGVAPRARDLPAPYRPGRAAVLGRGLPGRNRAEEWHRTGHRHRPHHPRADPRGNQPDRFSRDRAEQVPGQDRLGLAQARRPVRDSAAAGGRIPAAAAGEPRARRGQGDGRQAGGARHRHLRRPAAMDAAGPGRRLRQLRPQPVQPRTWCRRAAGGA